MISTVIVGYGARADLIYAQILPALRERLSVTAVCDPREDARDKATARLGVPAFSSLEKAIAETRPQAAIVLTRPEAHFSTAHYLLQSGIHTMVETPITTSLLQARKICDQAKRSNVVFGVAEQFFRDPVDRLAQAALREGLIGRVGRCLNFQNHIGYHNNSRHQVLFGSAPNEVQCIRHEMAMDYTFEKIHYPSEAWQNISFFLPDGMLITDCCGNFKGAVGRYCRPGLQEYAGDRGVYAQSVQTRGVYSAELRILRDHSPYGETDDYPVEFLFEGELDQPRQEIGGFYTQKGDFAAARIQLPDREIMVENPARHFGIGNQYLQQVAECLLEFSAQIADGTAPVFTPQMACHSLEMEIAAEVSARHRGERISYPLSEAHLMEVEQERLQHIEDAFGLDPLDVEAGIRQAFPTVRPV